MQTLLTHKAERGVREVELCILHSPNQQFTPTPNSHHQSSLRLLRLHILQNHSRARLFQLLDQAIARKLYHVHFPRLSQQHFPEETRS